MAKRTVLAVYATCSVGGVCHAGTVQNKASGLDLRCALSAKTFDKGADYSIILPVAPEGDIGAKDVGRVIPQTMQPTNDQGKIAAQIVDRSMNSYFDSADFKNSGIGRQTKSVEKKMQQNVAFGGGDDPMATRHVFKFQMKATDQKAMVDYTGFFNAELSYQAGIQTTNLEVFEDLAARTKVVLAHLATPTDTRNVVSLRYNF